MTALASHRFEEHVGELELRIRAPTLAALFEEAGRALAAVMLGDGKVAAADLCSVEDVVVEARDREALLVAWLNELIYRCEVEKRVFPFVTVRDATERHLAASLRGVEPAGPATEVKAATWHRAGIAEVNGMLEATIVLDV